MSDPTDEAAEEHVRVIRADFAALTKKYESMGFHPHAAMLVLHFLATGCALAVGLSEEQLKENADRARNLWSLGQRRRGN